MLFIQAYYTLYLIYTGFKLNMLDKVTKAYNQETILKILQKNLGKKNKNCYVVIANIENIEDITERYGIGTSDIILRGFAVYLNKFLGDYNFKQIKIGYYGGGNFLFAIQSKKEVLFHIFSQLTHQLKNSSLENREVKINIEIIESKIQEIDRQRKAKLYQNE